MIFTWYEAPVVIPSWKLAQVLVKRRFAAVEGFALVLFAEWLDKEFQADDSLPPDAFLVFGEGPLEPGVGPRGIFQGVQENPPVGPVQGQGLVFLD